MQKAVCLLTGNCAIYDDLENQLSIFSMDGDVTDLRQLAGWKQKYPNVLLYIDEAHAIGVRGHLGLGCAEEQGCIAEIDFLIGTLGKAFGSTGGYIVYRRLIRDYLINKMRSLIYNTTIPPVNLMWSKFVLERLPNFQDRRQQLRDCSARLRILLQKKQRFHNHKYRYQRNTFSDRWWKRNFYPHIPCNTGKPERHIAFVVSTAHVRTSRCAIVFPA